MGFLRGSVVKGPDLLAGYEYRPYVRISDESHPFSEEEALYAAVTTTERPIAIPLTEDDCLGWTPQGKLRESVDDHIDSTCRHSGRGGATC